jgi:NADH-quinone oxidoreductase subunit G/NADP-reducing hydrogenase subunit HndD
MGQIEVNGKSVPMEEGEILLKVLERNGVEVPTLCNMRDMFPSGACRMCVVEVEGQRNLVPSCAFPVATGMKVQTHSPRVVNARKTIIELLLANHPDDCLFCSRNRECELQDLAAQYQVRGRRFMKSDKPCSIDNSSPSVVREQSKCILCGRCVRTCEEVMGVSCIDFAQRGSKSQVGTAFNAGLNSSSCVSCGQCIMVCPTGALSERDSSRHVLAALVDRQKYVVVQHAPAVSVTLGEYFGVKPGKDVDGLLVAALRRMGFKKVFDTSFTADLTIMEEGSEFVARVKSGGTLPMLTSCSPAWISFVEEFYPDFIPNLSTCKSPQQMLGALVKSYFAEREKIDLKNLVSVSVMPCTAKKREADREEMLGAGHVPDVDHVLTTRELAKMIREMGIDFNALTPEEPDLILGERSSAGKIFGVTGGVMEAALRSAHFLITGREMRELTLKDVRGLDGIKEAQFDIDGLIVKVAVVNGLGNARRVLDDVRKGLRSYHFIEVMSCPGGCIAGGGQPYFTDPERIRARMQGLYEIDKRDTLRLSHHNRHVQELYQNYLGKPLGELSHRLLHTHYQPRERTRG